MQSSADGAGRTGFLRDLDHENDIDRDIDVTQGQHRSRQVVAENETQRCHADAIPFDDIGDNFRCGRDRGIGGLTREGCPERVCPAADRRRPGQRPALAGLTKALSRRDD
jgi:hypothetical protein